MRENKYYQEIILPLFTASNIQLINFFMRTGLLKCNIVCKACSCMQKLVKANKNIDCFAWRCMQTNCSKYKVYSSIRKNSIFSDLKISFHFIIQILWRWNLETTNEHIMDEIPVSSDTLIKFFKKLRNCCRLFNLNNPLRLGGEGIICQLDESLFRHKPKYHVGRCTNHEIWIFGIVDTSYVPARGYLQCVQNRTKKVLLPIIKRIVRSGTIIHSDEWSSYKILQRNGFCHDTVNYSLNFVNPITGTHTQHVESFWNNQKYRVKIKKGINGELLQEYCEEWMWRDNIGFGIFQNLIDLIKFYG